MADILQYVDEAFDRFRAFVQTPRTEPRPGRPVTGQFREAGSKLFLSLHPNKRFAEDVKPAPHTHSYMELVYVHKGRLYQQVNGESLTMGEGSLMLLGCGAVHQPWVTTSEDIVVNLGVRYDAISEMLSRLDTVDSAALSRLGGMLPGSAQASGPSALLIPNAPVLSDLVNEMFCEYHREDEWVEHVLANDLVRLIIEFCRQDDAAKQLCRQDPSDSDALLSDIRAYIDQHYTALTMEQLSRHFNYSERQMRRLLREMSEDGLPEMLNKMRIRRACDYMARGLLSTREIIGRVGFNDPAYFSRVFKSVTGMSVRDYRHQLAGNP